MQEHRLVGSNQGRIGEKQITLIRGQDIQLNFAVLAVRPGNGDVKQRVILDQKFVGIGQGQVTIAQGSIGNDVVATSRSFPVGVGVVVGENSQNFLIAQNGIIRQIVAIHRSGNFYLHRMGTHIVPIFCNQFIGHGPKDLVGDVYTPLPRKGI